jgi:hypothetical protein
MHFQTHVDINYFYYNIWRTHSWSYALYFLNTLYIGNKEEKREHQPKLYVDGESTKN